jgi:hypothetical protein
VTSRDLIIEVRRYPLLRGLDIRLEDPDILASGNRAQEQILEELEPIEETGTLTFVADQAVYAFTGIPNDPLAWLKKARRIIEPIVYVDNSLAITETTESWVEMMQGRHRYPYYYKTARPRRYYQMRAVPLSLGFFGIPTSTLATTVRYVRQHSSDDNLIDQTAGPHPLVPYTEAMVRGTVAKLLEGRMDRFPKEAGAAGTLFLSELNRLGVVRGRPAANRRIDKHEADTLWF